MYNIHVHTNVNEFLLEESKLLNKHQICKTLISIEDVKPFQL